jgi:isopenicillin N synthase-like dioxygenase
MNTKPKREFSDPRLFLQLSKEERKRLLEQQAKEIAGFYQPGNSHIEWTEDYQEDSHEPIAQTR